MFGIILIYIYFLVEYGKPEFLYNLSPGIVLQAVALLYIFHHRSRLPEILKDRLMILYLLLLLEMIYHGPTASNNYWALNKFEAMVGNFIIMLLFCVVIDSQSRLIQVLAGYIICMLVISIPQIVFGYRIIFGTRGSLGDTNDLAAAMNVLIPVCYYLGRASKSYKKLIFWSAGFIFILCNISAFSRSGFVGMVAVALLIIYHSKNRIAALALAVVVAITISALYLPKGYVDEIQSISEEGADSGTGKQRIELWKIALETFYHNPILGVGQGNLEWVYEKYQDPNNEYWKRGVGGKSVHSIYLTLITELGIIGGILFILILKNTYDKFKHVDNLRKSTGKNINKDELVDVNMGIAIGLVGFLVSGIFLSSFYYPQIWNLLGLITSINIISKQFNPA